MHLGVGECLWKGMGRQDLVSSVAFPYFLEIGSFANPKLTILVGSLDGQ